MNINNTHFKNKCIWGLVNIIIPLLGGAIYYYIFCPDVIFVKAIDSLLKGRHHVYIHNDYAIIKLIRFYLLDFIWAYSLVNCIFIFCDFSNKLKALVKSAIISATMIASMELFQLLNLIKGTFDILDILVEIIAIIIASIIINIFYGGIINEK